MLQLTATVGLYSKWTCIQLKIKGYWCWQTINSLSQITHAYKMRGSVPSGPPHMRASHRAHTSQTWSGSHSRSITKTKSCPSGNDAGGSGVGERIERKYLDGICKTNGDREINTPIWLKKKKSLGWAENIWKHLEKVYLPLVKKGFLRLNFRNVKVIPFLTPWVLWTP